MVEDLRVAGRAARDAQQQAGVYVVRPHVERDGAQAEDHVREVVVRADLSEPLDFLRQPEPREQA